jgi:hypothetical protein
MSKLVELIVRNLRRLDAKCLPEAQHREQVNALVGGLTSEEFAAVTEAYANSPIEHESLESMLRRNGVDVNDEPLNDHGFELSDKASVFKR